MKMFAFSLKMVGSNGSQARRVIGSIDVKDIMELADVLNKQDFIVVEKFHEQDLDLIQVGPEILAQKVIGTVREYKKRVDRARYEE